MVFMVKDCCMLSDDEHLEERKEPAFNCYLLLLSSCTIASAYTLSVSVSTSISALASPVTIIVITNIIVSAIAFAVYVQHIVLSIEEVTACLGHITVHAAQTL